ncbi:hypothetical protein KO494_09625 [Lacinutrix sp. C3R15]|uniref:DUF6786 family protein n=1 Tax=Flavobacteriaceae TaxID=49546 RepID=UPI001C088F00|nr:MULTISPECIES: DUF6786 family protein [Flavobacteriaceae]MBU2939797.1 hypothetical protein [Lacinutrix sp. C3R15]MDO6623112.1 hypothetical protein [Oceanihabitans sp. 1_MG-2023]
MTDTIKKENSFIKDLNFLKKHTDIIVLQEGNSALAIAPQYQGRVMTSTTNLAGGSGFGWINKKVIETGFLTEEERKGRLENQIYVFGGEERFWLGPEGGQFSLFFKEGDNFDFSNWKTPAVIDTDAFTLISKTENAAKFEHSCELINKSGTVFKMGIGRSVTILNKNAIKKIIKKDISTKIEFVGYETNNQITNIGEAAWIPETGLPSIWMLGMYNPSPKTTVVIPFKEGSEIELGEKVNDAYFGKVPKDYLEVKEEVLFFKGDGTKRSKIGINSKRTKGIAGSYDALGKVLTLVTYNTQEAPHGYVNSAWEHQEKPYAGDVINAYNDGSPEAGVPPMGPFYELETSSPAAALNPKETMVHIQTTIHLQGNENELNEIAIENLGVGLEEIIKAL